MEKFVAVKTTLVEDGKHGTYALSAQNRQERLTMHCAVVQPLAEKVLA